MIARMFVFESIMLECACHMSRHATRVHATRFASAKQTTTVGPWTPKGPFIIIRAWHGSGGWERMQGKQPHQVCFSASSRVWEDEFTPHTWTCWLMYLHFFRDVKYDF